ncbi:hypothetical protein [Streptomyces sp. NPDC037389]|uniref:hypothetical protein n=1 Tax=Streptomyces sp. NPDC037389 TaxID=3155369 RepID=UPI0033C5DBF9
MVLAPAARARVAPERAGRPGERVAPGPVVCPGPEARERVVPVVQAGRPAPGERARAAREPVGRAPEARPEPVVCRGLMARPEPVVRAQEVPVRAARVPEARERVAPGPVVRAPEGQEPAVSACGSAATPPRPHSRREPAR